MRAEFSAVRMTIHLHGSETWQHKPVAAEVIHRAHQFGMAGASVLHGIEGFGASSEVHTARLTQMGDQLPVAIVIVDTPDRIREFLPQLDSVVDHGLITLDEVTAIRYTPSADNDRGR